MKNPLSFLSILWIILFAAVTLQAEQARNPIVWADIPDPSIIRVGDIYYMSSTTMHMSPGLPIMKSKDLVNWDLVGYAYDTLGDNDALNLKNSRGLCGIRLFSDRHHNQLAGGRGNGTCVLSLIIRVKMNRYLMSDLARILIVFGGGMGASDRSA